MGLLDFLKKPTKPYKDDAANAIYELLFCDNMELYKSNIPESNQQPWITLFSETPSQSDLEQIINDPNSEPRIKILAYNKLISIGEKSKTKELLGVIIEVGLDNGLDTLAAFNNGTARYINQTGKIIVWETGNEQSTTLINRLFLESSKIVEQIGPWEKPRLQFPKKGNVRITFLVSDGLYFGEGPSNVLFNDPVASAALAVALEVLNYLTEQAK